MVGVREGSLSGGKTALILFFPFEYQESNKSIYFTPQN